ncbi:hypothetical protein Nepgr_029986 [Nepenthes gracilis]|uniref:DUF4005 domain-containing protein n=1 Tax=Nepenthes gracilis TaxID=150966 RepID=A0AAD3TDM3_NEPGR|nr:hypothetical protein Nepgr_029986 [Nepenthes gracilis]
MGRASKWFNKLLRRKKAPPDYQGADAANRRSQGSCTDDLYDGPERFVDPSKQAIVVAAATAAVAEAALAAAKAAAEVSAFRGYLARRALRALKGLVKLQALVRGYLVRKQGADMLRRMQAMVRLQARARANRVQNLECSHYGLENTGDYDNKLSANLSKMEQSTIAKVSRCSSRSNMREEVATNWLENWMECPRGNQGSLKLKHADDDRNDKILEVDCWRPHPNPQGRNRIHNPTAHDYLDHSFAASDSVAIHSWTNLQKPNASPYSDQEVSSIRSVSFPLEAYIPESSPQAYSGQSRPRSTGKSSRRNECSSSFLASYMSGHPNYMSNTESSQAKARCHSTPRQRPDVEKPSYTRRSSYACPDPTSYSRRASDLGANSTRNLYSGSGRLDRLVIPACEDPLGRYHWC